MCLPNQAENKYNFKSISASSRGSWQETFVLILNNVVILIIVVEVYFI